MGVSQNWGYQFWGLYWGPLILGNYHINPSHFEGYVEIIYRLGLGSFEGVYKAKGYSG